MTDHNTSEENRTQLRQQCNKYHHIIRRISWAPLMLYCRGYTPCLTITFSPPSSHPNFFYPVELAQYRCLVKCWSHEWCKCYRYHFVLTVCKNYLINVTTDTQVTHGVVQTRAILNAKESVHSFLFIIIITSLNFVTPCFPSRDVCYSSELYWSPDTEDFPALKPTIIPYYKVFLSPLWTQDVKPASDILAGYLILAIS